MADMTDHGSVVGKDGTAYRQVTVRTVTGGMNVGSVWIEIATRTGRVSAVTRLTPEDASALAENLTKAADHAYNANPYATESAE